MEANLTIVGSAGSRHIPPCIAADRDWITKKKLEGDAFYLVAPLGNVNCRAGHFLERREIQLSRRSFSERRIPCHLASKLDMIHKGIEFAIRAGLGRDQWTALIYYPGAANEGKNATVVRVAGTRQKTEAVARGRIDYWLKNQRKVHRELQS